MSPTFYEQNPTEMAEWINALEGERLILTSDLGQYSAAPHPEGLRMILASLLDYGEEHASPWPELTVCCVPSPTRWSGRCSCPVPIGPGSWPRSASE